MAFFNKTQKQAEKLINQYLILQEEEQALEQKLKVLQEKIALFSRKHKMKTLRSKTHLLYIVQKLKTIFPRKGQPGRPEVEQLLKKYQNDLKYALKFDIVKLANAYDQKKLSPPLMKELKRYAKKEKFIKLSVRKLKKRS